MKYYRLLALFLAAALLLVGCSNASLSGKLDHGPGASSESDTTDGQGPVSYDDRLIYELLHEEGSYTTAYEEEAPYFFYIPQLKAETQAAKAINEEIMQDVGRFAQNQLQIIQEKGTPEMDCVSWHSHWLDSTVSLVIEKGYGDPLVYHYDFAQENIPDNREILQRAGLTEEEFLTRARTAAAQSFDFLYAGMPMDDWYGPNYYGSILPLRAQTLQSVQLDQMLLYPDADEFAFRTPFYTQAGAEYQYNSWYYNVCTIAYEPLPPVPEKTVSDGLVTAVLRENRLWISFADSPELNPYFYGSLFELPVKELSANTEYPVQGLFSEYTDLALGNIGQDYAPFIALLTRDGGVELVDVLDSLRYGVPCSFPAYGLWQIEELQADENSCEIYAVDAAGTQYALGDWVMAKFNSTPVPLADNREYVSPELPHKTDGGTGYISRYTLRFGNNEGHTLLFADDYPDVGLLMEEEGTYRLLGAADEGLLYFYNLYDMENMLCGTIQVRHTWLEEAGHYDDSGALDLRWCAGDDLFDQGAQWIPFSPQWLAVG